MATFLCVSNPISHFTQFPSFKRAPLFPNSPLLLRIPSSDPKQWRGSALVARASPSLNNILFAIALPSSLLAVTIVAALKIGDNLDRQWLQEIAKNEAVKEVEDDDDDGDSDNDDDRDGEEDDMENYVQEQPALSRARNRPKREA